MSSALINDLKSLVLGEQRSISAEWLANHARVTVHETQKVLKEFAAGPGKASTRILYYVSGLTPAGSMRICLVPESGVQAARKEMQLVFSCQPYSVEPSSTTAPDSLWNESMTQLRSFVLDPSSPEAEHFWANKSGHVHLDDVSISEATAPIPVAAAVAAGVASSSGPRIAANKPTVAPAKPKAVKSTSASSFFGAAKGTRAAASEPAKQAPQKSSAAPPSTLDSRMSIAFRKRAEARAKRDAALFDDEEEDTSKLGVSASGARSKAEADAAMEESAAPAVARKRPRKDVVDDSDSDSAVGAAEVDDKEAAAAEGAPKKARGGSKKEPTSGDGTLGDIPQGQYEEMGLKRDKKGNLVLPEADAAVMDAFVEGGENGSGGGAAGTGKKSQKLVEYTYMDDSGYMVTSKKYVDCEEDDPEAASGGGSKVPTAKPAPKRTPAPSAASKPKGGAGKPKAAKQAGLMSFFGKKK